MKILLVYFDEAIGLDAVGWLQAAHESRKLKQARIKPCCCLAADDLPSTPPKDETILRL
jgi:hypothetical protein